MKYYVQQNQIFRICFTSPTKFCQNDSKSLIQYGWRKRISKQHGEHNYAVDSLHNRCWTNETWMECVHLEYAISDSLSHSCETTVGSRKRWQHWSCPEQQRWAQRNRGDERNMQVRFDFRNGVKMLSLWKQKMKKVRVHNGVNNKKLLPYDLEGYPSSCRNMSGISFHFSSNY